MEQTLYRSDYITDKSELVDYFYKNCKKKTDFKTGIEYEKLGIRPDNYRAVSYSGNNSIAAFLERLRLHDNYQVTRENDNILGLTGEYGNVTLEPGCQFEFSTRPMSKLKDLEVIISDFNEQTRSIADDLGITWIGHGIQPISTFNDMEMIPKERYSIMRSYLPHKGHLSPVMMMETAGIQTTLDFESEEDAMKKLKVALAISPILTAMFANSPIRDGKLTGYKSYRAHAWLNTDNDRCGIINKRIFENDFGFEDYVETLLDVPMFFKKTGMTFRNYMKNYEASMDDWFLHMTTFFPDVRMKNFLEVRNCDCQKEELIMAFPALIKGIMYNDSAIDAAWDLVKHLSWEKRNGLRTLVPKHGLDTRLGNFRVIDIAKELVSIAEVSLKDDSVYLQKIKELLQNNTAPADIIIMKWDSEWNREIKKLIEYTRL